MDNRTDDFVAEAARREVMRQYQKEWRAKNPDKVREKNRRYWEKKAQAYRDSLNTVPPSKEGQA